MTGVLVLKQLACTTLDTEPCPVCGRAGDVEISVHQRYAALVTKWLPLFGMGVRTGAACLLCGQMLKDPMLHRRAQLNPPLRAALADLKRSCRRTLWQRLYPWSLTIIFVVVVAVWVGVEVRAVNAVKERDAQAREYVMDPRVGDVYKVDWLADEGPMTGALLRVVSIDGDIMTLERSTMPTDDLFDPGAWAALSDGEAAFGGGVYTVSLSHLQEHGDDGYGEFYGFEGQPRERLYADLIEGWCGIDNIVERAAE